MDTSFLCLLHEFFFAFGAGDADLALSPGNSHLLAAAGAVKIAVLPGGQPLFPQQKPVVFLVPLIGVPGEGAEQTVAQKTVA